MKLTRRNVLRFGAFSLASATSPTWARNLGLYAPVGTGPAASSVLVLVEGPWLYTQPTVNGDLQCISLPDPHQCQMGIWNAAKGNVVSPYDASQDGPLLPSGAAFVSKLTSANPRPDVVTVFDAAFYRDDVDGADNFVYLRNTKLTATAKSGDRTVAIPVPDHLYVAGRVLNAVITDANVPPLVVNPATARLFVTYIFEYTQDARNATSLTFDDGTGKTFTVTKGQNLLFRLQADQPDTADVPHILHSFSEQISRIDKGQLPISIAFPTGTANADIQLGVNAQGLTADELGLHVTSGLRAKHKKHKLKIGALASCQGGGIGIVPAPGGG
jgi:hypothetical protein